MYRNPLWNARAVSTSTPSTSTRRWRRSSSLCDNGASLFSMALNRLFSRSKIQPNQRARRPAITWQARPIPNAVWKYGGSLSINVNGVQIEAEFPSPLMIPIAAALLAGGRGIEDVIQLNKVPFMAKTKITRNIEKYLGPKLSTVMKMTKPVIVMEFGWRKNLRTNIRSVLIAYFDPGTVKLTKFDFEDDRTTLRGY